MILADTNILLRSLHPQHPHYRPAQATLAELRRRVAILCLAPQNLVEFWAVATRPRIENGLGMTIENAAREMDSLVQFFRVLSYSPEVVAIWRRILVEHKVSGKQAHDAHLIAVMQMHSVETILTFNGRDFQRYPGITILDPALV